MQIVNGLNYLHNNRIIHRDLKPDNILFQSHQDILAQHVLKIADLDDLVRLNQTFTKTHEVSRETGTCKFMSPEMIAATDNEGNVGRRTDIWSLGCLVLEMSRRDENFCFIIKNNEQTERKVIDHNTSSYRIMYIVGNGGVPEVPDHVPSEIKCFIERCCQRDSLVRPSAKDLLAHSWTADSAGP